MILLFEENTNEFYIKSPSGEIVSYYLGIGSLNDATSCLVKEELNGGYELEMEYPISGSHYSDIKHDRIIFTEANRYDEPQAFRIYKISKPYNGLVTINAAHISYDLNKYAVTGIDAQNIDTVFSQLNSNNVFGNEQKQFIFEKKGEGYADNEIKFDTPTNVRSVLLGETGSVLDIYGGDYSFNNFKVIHHKSGRGATKGISIRYGKNLTDITEDTDNNNVYTHLFPFYRKEVTETSFPESRVYDTFYIFDDSKRYTKEWLCDENALTPDGVPKTPDAGGTPSTFDATQYNTRSVIIDTTKGDPEKDLGSLINGLYTYGMGIPAYVNNDLPSSLNGRAFQPLNKILLDEDRTYYSWPKIIRATDIDISQDGRITITKLGDVFTVKSGTGISVSYNHWVWVGSLPGEEVGDLDTDGAIDYVTEGGKTATKAGYYLDQDNPRGFTLLSNALGTQKEPFSNYDNVGRGFWSISAYDVYIRSSNFPKTNKGLSFTLNGDVFDPKNYGGSIFHIVGDSTEKKGDCVGNFYYFNPTIDWHDNDAYQLISSIDNNNNKVLYPQWISFESKTNTHIDSLNLIYDIKAKTVEGKSIFDIDWLVDEDDNPITPENNKKYFIIEDVNKTDILSYENTLVSYETENGYQKISDVNERGLSKVSNVNSEIQNGLIKVGSLDLTDEFDELPTPRELNNACQKYVIKNKIGGITKNITLDMITLSQTEEYSFLKTSDDIELGDHIQVIHGPLKIYSSDERVISLTYDPIHKIYTEIELGEKKKSTATNTLTKGSGVSELKNDSDYTNAQEAADMIFKSVQAKEGRFSSADIDFLTSNEIVASLIKASVANIDSVVATMLKAENAEISNTLKAGGVVVKGDIEATNIIAKESGQIAGLTIKKETLDIYGEPREGYSLYAYDENSQTRRFNIFAYDEQVSEDEEQRPIYQTKFLLDVNNIQIHSPTFDEDVPINVNNIDISSSFNMGVFVIQNAKLWNTDVGTETGEHLIDFNKFISEYNTIAHLSYDITGGLGAYNHILKIECDHVLERSKMFIVSYYVDGVYKQIIQTIHSGNDSITWSVATTFFRKPNLVTKYVFSTNNSTEVSFNYSTEHYAIAFNQNVVPEIDDHFSFGDEGHKWFKIWSSNPMQPNGGAQTGSDLAIKKDISYDITKFDKFFDSLKPATFKYKDGTSGRDHVGFIAQDVKQAMDENDISTSEFAGYCEEHTDNQDEDVIQRSLRYDEFIALLVDQVQTLKQKVEQLEAKLPENDTPKNS